MSIVRKKSNACEMQGGTDGASQIVKRNRITAPGALTAAALAFGLLLSACTSGSGVGGEGTVDGTIDPVPADVDTPEDTEAPADE